MHAALSVISIGAGDTKFLSLLVDSDPSGVVERDVGRIWHSESALYRAAAGPVRAELPQGCHAGVTCDAR